jgi:selenide,water dikinase
VTTTSTDPALLVGLDAPDDAAVYRISDDLALVQTVDFFTPIVDDPRSWGRIAAANSLSDVYAMGGRPITALNLVGWPRSLGFELLGEVLEGGEEVCSDAGVQIVGGHSVDDPEPKYGLAVTGTIEPERVVRKAGALPGSVLILTKALGTGVISSALKEGKAEDAVVEAATRSMTRLNRDAAQVMVEAGASAATDVTGFGLVGHLLQMLNGELDAHLDAASIPLLPGAPELAASGILSGGSRRNRQEGEAHVDAPGVDESIAVLLFDAQTSGGLLMAIDPDRTDAVLRRLFEAGDEVAAVIGRIEPGEGKVVVT